MYSPILCKKLLTELRGWVKSSKSCYLSKSTCISDLCRDQRFSHVLSEYDAEYILMHPPASYRPARMRHYSQKYYDIRTVQDSRHYSLISQWGYSLCTSSQKGIWCALHDRAEGIDSSKTPRMYLFVGGLLRMCINDIL